MVQRQTSAVVLLDYGERRTADSFFYAQTSGDITGKGRLSCTKVTYHGYNIAGAEAFTQTAPEIFCFFFVFYFYDSLYLHNIYCLCRNGDILL